MRALPEVCARSKQVSLRGVSEAVPPAQDRLKCVGNSNAGTMASTWSPKVVRLKPMTATSHNVVPRKSSRSPFSNASKPSHFRPSALRISQRPASAARIPPQALFTLSTAVTRHASSTPTTNEASIPDDVLTWDRFFDLRRKRRYVNLGCSLLTAVGTIGVFGPVIAQQDIDGWAAQISGLDPFIVLGISTFAIATGGWLCGPTFGNGMFKLWAGRRGWNLPIAEVGIC